MPGLTIGWDYLTGYCVATDPASRQRAEWPPHPGRVFMALAAAWFETGEDADEGNALRWLEKLNDPKMTLPAQDAVFHREVVTVFVPVNDSAGPSAALLQSAPSITRSKQARTFPSVWVGDAPCFLHWPDAAAMAVETHRPALDRLCGKVTRIGHSSSLVRMWVADEVRSPRSSEIWAPDVGLADFQARRVSEGTLNLLDRWFNRREREAHERLSGEISKLATAKKAVKGKGSKDKKAEMDVEIGRLEERLQSVNNRDPIRPKLGLWSGYRRRESKPLTTAQRTHFDSDFLILTQDNGPRLPSVSTLAVTQALRGAVMKRSTLQPPPPWVSGHLEAGQPLRDGKQHLAFLPLPFVSSEYADGHLLGVALAFPGWVSRKERGRVLGPILLEPSGEPKPIELQLGSLGVWTIMKRDWSEPRKGLKPETWSAHPEGSRSWASVTPVVLDGLPKEDRLRDRSAWNSEVLAMLVTACQRVGLPHPESVDFDTTSWHLGSPRAAMKRRPLRGHPEVADSSAGLGDGFPHYPAKGTNGIRPQFHVWLRFAEPVVGPVVLGAGRFLGYGLCKPLWGGPNS
jgi:CRISPR-associated protein Csb2